MNTDMCPQTESSWFDRLVEAYRDQHRHPSNGRRLAKAKAQRAVRTLQDHGLLPYRDPAARESNFPNARRIS